MEYFLITTIFPRIYARTYYAHPRARVMSFSLQSRSLLQHLEFKNVLQRPFLLSIPQSHSLRSAATAVVKAASPCPNAFAALQGDEVSTAASLDAAAKAAAKVSKVKPRKVASFPAKAVDPAFADITFKELKPLDSLSFLPKKK